MLQIKKILFPVDFSDNCIGAARYVEALAGQFEAEITLLHVVGMDERTPLQETVAARQAQLDRFLAGELKYFTTHRICTSGDPAMVIAKTAQTLQPDLVMMPTHGLGYFRRHLLGSVTAKVLHDIQCPVWTSVHTEAAPKLEEIHCHRILCAINNSERNRRILEWGSWLSGEFQATLAIVHATEKTDASAFGWSLGSDFGNFVMRHAKKHVEALQSEAGTAAQVFIDAGDPARVVSCAAKEFKADVIVIGRHGTSGPEGHLFQHAYAIVRESPCPVISI